MIAADALQRERERERERGKEGKNGRRREERGNARRTLGERHPRTEAYTRRRDASQGRRNRDPPRRRTATKDTRTYEPRAMSIQLAEQVFAISMISFCRRRNHRVVCKSLWRLLPMTTVPILHSDTETFGRSLARPVKWQINFLNSRSLESRERMSDLLRSRFHARGNEDIAKSKLAREASRYVLYITITLSRMFLSTRFTASSRDND